MKRPKREPWMHQVNDVTKLCDLTAAIEALEVAGNRAHRGIISDRALRVIGREWERLRELRDEVVLRVNSRVPGYPERPTTASSVSRAGRHERE